MDLQINTDNRLPYRPSSAGQSTGEISRMDFAYGGGELIRIQFRTGDVVARRPVGCQLIFALKKFGVYAGPLLAFSNAFETPDDDAGYYTALVPFTNAAIATDLGSNATGRYMVQICWIDPGEMPQRTPPIEALIYNQVYSVGEAIPLGVGLSVQFPVVLTSVTGETGGTAADLDAVPTAAGAFPVGGILQYVDAVRGLVSYQLRAGAEAEAPLAVVWPADRDEDAPLYWASV